MAEHAHAAPIATGAGAEHTATYAGFLKGAVALVIYCGYIVVALACFGFVSHPLNTVMGFIGLIVGAIAVLIDARAGNRWYLAGGLLVVFGLLTAISAS